MNAHACTLKLLAWLQDRESASVGDIAAAGLMNSRQASDVVRYALRNGAIAKTTSGKSGRGATRYRATGASLPEQRSGTTAPCFDGLLSAWGIAQEPPQLPVVGIRVYQIADSA
jgi:hypothetical protein